MKLKVWLLKKVPWSLLVTTARVWLGDLLFRASFKVRPFAPYVLGVEEILRRGRRPRTVQLYWPGGHLIFRFQSLVSRAPSEMAARAEKRIREALRRERRDLPAIALAIINLERVVAATVSVEGGVSENGQVTVFDGKEPGGVARELIRKLLSEGPEDPGRAVLDPAAEINFEDLSRILRALEHWERLTDWLRIKGG